MDIENLITTKQKEVDKLAQNWILFVSQHPEISHFVLKQEFVAWAHTRNIDTSIWIGKEIRDVYFYLRQKHEEEQMEHTGHFDSHDIPPGLGALAFLGTLFSRERPKILEQDPHFKRILNEKADQWLKAHPGKDTNSKEWIDYRYGSLENFDAPTLFSHTEKEFKTKHESLWKKYNEERKKVYDDPTKDSTLIWHQEEIVLHTQARHELLKKTDPSVTIEHVQKQVETAHWERFVEKHPEKAAVYAQKHEDIKEAIVRVEEKKKHITTQIASDGTDEGVRLLDRRGGEAATSTPPRWTAPITPIIELVDPQSKPIGSVPPAVQPIPQQPIFQQQPRPTTPPSFLSTANSGRIPSALPAGRPPIPGGGGIGNAIRNGLSSFIPGLGGKNPLANLAKNAAIRSALAVVGPILFVSIMTFAIVFGAIGGEATTLEASPEENKSDISPTISPPSQSPLSETAKEGPLGDYNKMIANITNGSYNATKRTGEFINTSPRGLYWCTNLVIDTYNLAGKSGLNDNHQAVISMRNFWKTSPGYIHLDYLNGNYQNILSAISPGFAIFFESQPGVFTGNEHVAIIKSKNIDSRGNGFVETYDANTNAKTQRYPVVNWDVKNQLYTLVGFGTTQ